MFNEGYYKKFLHIVEKLDYNLPDSVQEATNNSGFLRLLCESPASTQWHGNYRGGLIEHIYYVMKSAVALSAPFIKDNLVNMLDVVEVVFWHDIGKIGLFNKSGDVIEFYYKNNGDGTYSYNDNISSTHQEFSVLNYMVFSDKPSYEIVRAIRYHNMLYTDTAKTIGKETPLMLLLHWADMYASRFLV